LGPEVVPASGGHGIMEWMQKKIDENKGETDEIQNAITCVIHREKGARDINAPLKRVQKHA
jgi:hypothetical protein